MTARDALAEQNLTLAVTRQRHWVTQHPEDAEARLFLFELLVLAGDLLAAREELAAIRTDAPNWFETRRRYDQQVRAEMKRTPIIRRPHFLLEAPSHARRRWNAIRADRIGEVERMQRCRDGADANTPEVRGFVDGREFHGLRDGDDRFASVLELFVGSKSVWVPFEQMRSLKLEPGTGVMDVAFRPGALKLTDGRSLSAVVPLRYPKSAQESDEHALAVAVDWQSSTCGLTIGIGLKVLFVGEEELPLAHCRMIEIRG